MYMEWSINYQFSLKYYDGRKHVMFVGRLLIECKQFVRYLTTSRIQRELTKMASGSTVIDPWYASLLGLAETFRTSNPPNIRLCIHCLQSIFNFKPPPIIEARTHLQLGNILLAHTKNTDLARTHLETAVSWTTHVCQTRLHSDCQ